MTIVVTTNNTGGSVTVAAGGSVVAPTAVKKTGDMSVNNIRVSGSSGSSISAAGGASSAALVVKKSGDLTIQGLSNVVSTDLQDGYTLVFDSDLNKWVTQAITAVATSLDGGTY